VQGCEDPATAIRRADAFAMSVSQQGVEDATFWASKASDYLRAYFHAAALAGLDLTAVARWVTGLDNSEAEAILAESGTETGWHWASQLAELRGEANKTAQTIRMTMSRALAFLGDPALAASVRPAPGRSFDLAARHQRPGAEGDTSCPLADPLASTRNFAELLVWATTGKIPDPYLPYASGVTGTGTSPTQVPSDL
jgi:hypothetical protein